MTELDELSVYPHYYIRQSVVEVYHEILQLMQRTFPNPKKWSPGVAIPLHKNTKLAVDSVCCVLLCSSSSSSCLLAHFIRCFVA